jgi:hypothetical protein
MGRLPALRFQFFEQLRIILASFFSFLVYYQPWSISVTKFECTTAIGIGFPLNLAKQITLTTAMNHQRSTLLRDYS